MGYLDFEVRKLEVLADLGPLRDGALPSFDPILVPFSEREAQTVLGISDQTMLLARKSGALQATAQPTERIGAAASVFGFFDLTLFVILEQCGWPGPISQPTFQVLSFALDELYESEVDSFPNAHGKCSMDASVGSTKGDALARCSPVLSIDSGSFTRMSDRIARDFPEYESSLDGAHLEFVLSDFLVRLLDLEASVLKYVFNVPLRKTH